jgi:hypothetical protein
VMTSRVAGSPEDRFREHATGMILHTAAESTGCGAWSRELPRSNQNSSVGKERPRDGDRHRGPAWARLRERTTPAERPPLVGEVTANFLQIEGATRSA